MSVPAPGIWRRLAEDRWALTALILLVATALACVAAPLLTRQDPQLLREWLGAQPPGASHPDCQDRNRLALGEGIAWCELPTRNGTLTVTTHELAADTYRVLIRHGRLEIRAAGGVPVDRLDLAANPAQLRSFARSTWVRAPALRLAWGQTPPPDFFPPGERAIAVRVIHAVHDHRWEAVIREGLVEHLTCDGAARAATTIPGEAVMAVTWTTARGVAALTIDHPLGTDAGGRDLFARVLYGGRISLMVGIVATAVSLLIGVAYGAIAGVAGGRIDRLMMAGVDVLYALPFMFVVILLVVYVGNDVVVLFIALGAVQWLTMARIVRGQVLSLMRREFVLAAQAVGTRWPRLILRHLLPNTAGLIVVYAALTVPAVILEESFLSFIGIGIQYQHQTLDSWGALVNVGVATLDYRTGFAWWLLLFPALALVATLLALNVVGEGLRDALDVRER